MRLCLLLARRWPPYSKWLGRAFGQLPQAAQIAAALRAALTADQSAPRQDALCAAYEAAGAWQNTLGLAEAVHARRRPFHDRPYAVIGAQRFADALTARIADPQLARLGRPAPSTSSPTTPKCSCGPAPRARPRRRCTGSGEPQTPTDHSQPAKNARHATVPCGRGRTRAGPAADSRQAAARLLQAPPARHSTPPTASTAASSATIPRARAGTGADPFPAAASDAHRGRVLPPGAAAALRSRA
ncbi:hypothetical protein ACFQZ4_52420 [Catellatospora coxensis]